MRIQAGCCDERSQPSSQRQFARAQPPKCHPGRITDIVSGRRSITADTAVRLGRYFGDRPQFWIDLQGQYNIAVVEQERGHEIAKRVQASQCRLIVACRRYLVDAKRRHAALVRADGAITLGATVGSIHRVGALAQGLDACNGWAFWHVETPQGFTLDRRASCPGGRRDRGICR